MSQANKSKTTRTATDAFDISNYQMPEALRDIAERGVQQARESYERIKSVAEDATDVMEDTYMTAAKGFNELNIKSLETVRANINASFDFLRDLFAAKTVSEAVELQTTHLRHQFDTISVQSKELATLAQKVATQTASPVKESVEKALKKVA